MVPRRAFYAVGNAHLELGWLVAMEEPSGKTSRTFAAQLRLNENIRNIIFAEPARRLMPCAAKYYHRIIPADSAGRKKRASGFLKGTCG